MQALLDAAPRSRREGQRDECARQGEPAVAQEPRQQRERGEPGEKPRDPENRLIGGGHADRAKRRLMNGRAEPGCARRVVLKLGVAAPPAGVQPPRGHSDTDGVVEAVELTWVVVESENAAEG